MQEHYETLLQKAKDELEVLRKEVDMTHQNLRTTQNWYVQCWGKRIWSSLHMVNIAWYST